MFIRPRTYHGGPPNQRAQAIGRVMLGLAAANLVGVPAATWLGQAFGWRAAFGAVALRYRVAYRGP